jgi:hypothetical protein
MPEARSNTAELPEKLRGNFSVDLPENLTGLLNSLLPANLRQSVMIEWPPGAPCVKRLAGPDVQNGKEEDFVIRELDIAAS